MDRAIPDSLVDEYQYLIDRLTLPDSGDRHVPTIAIRCNASVIQKYFLTDIRASYGVESQYPDEFVENLFDLEAAAVVAVALRQRAKLKDPSIGVERYLNILFWQGLVQTTKALATCRAIL
ncbi:hypothetical protein [Lonsdalea quercina]|uniref:hypothetical protein n=1 Tax=Lonsdalea quercina TaxID=71657 RepID=UPI003975A688